MHRGKLVCEMCIIAVGTSANNSDDESDFGKGDKGGFDLQYTASRDPAKLEGKKCEAGTFKVGSGDFEKRLVNQTSSK